MQIRPNHPSLVPSFSPSLSRPFSLFLYRSDTPCAGDGGGRWPPHATATLAHSDSRCPMNALHFHTSPGGQRERLTRLFNPRSSYLLRFVRSSVRPLVSAFLVSFRSVSVLGSRTDTLHTPRRFDSTPPLTDALISEKSGARLAPRRKTRVVHRCDLHYDTTPRLDNHSSSSLRMFDKDNFSLHVCINKLFYAIIQNIGFPSDPR